MRAVECRACLECLACRGQCERITAYTGIHIIPGCRSDTGRLLVPNQNSQSPVKLDKEAWPPDCVSNRPLLALGPML